MTCAALGSLGDDLLLEILDWLRALVLKAQLESWPGQGPGRSPRSILSQQGPQTKEQLALGRTLFNLSSVNHHFRLILAPRVLYSVKLNVPYNNEDITAFLETVEASHMFKKCLENFTFTPNKRCGDKFTAPDKLLKLFGALEYIKVLNIAMPAGSIADFRNNMSKAMSPLFPNVTMLTIPLNASYVLRQCPKVHRLSLTFECERQRDFPALLHMSKSRTKFRSRLLTLNVTLRARRGSRAVIKVVELSVTPSYVQSSMVRIFKQVFDEAKIFVLHSQAEFDVKDLVDILRGWSSLERFHVDFTNVLFFARDGPACWHATRNNKAAALQWYTERMGENMAWMFRECGQLEIISYPAAGDKIYRVSPERKDSGTVKKVRYEIVEDI